tara:strand:- start:293 stop:1432 length:1140 start_codon:yes stop_codon:yes gene_type:complete
MSNNLHISGGVVYFVSGTVPPTFSQSIDSNGETNEHVIYPDTTLSSFKSFMLLDPLDNSSFIISGSNPTSSIYMSSSGKFGFGTTDPLVDFDIRTNEFQIQKQGKRQGIKVNKEGNLESYNSETSAAATGSEFILSYSRGGAGAITKEFLEAVGIMSIEEINNDFGGNALNAFNTFDPKTQDKLLFLIEQPQFSKLNQSAIGDVLGSIRWVASSGSTSTFNSRGAGEAARIEVTVDRSTPEGITSDMSFKLAVNPIEAPREAFRLDASGIHQMTGSLHITHNVRAAGSITAASLIGSLTGNATGLTGVPDIIVGSLTATSITSSIVTSSIIYTEGSNIFGDEITDTHTFNGHITASGNISASGIITANNIITTINGGSF